MIWLYLVAILIHCSFCSEKQDIIFTICNALYKTVDYLTESKDRLNLQGYFGIVRTKALLNEINLQWFNYNNTILLLKVHRKTDYLLNKNYLFLQHRRKWAHQMLEPNSWRKKIDYKYLINVCTMRAKNESIQLLYRMANEAETACITPDMFEFCISDMYERIGSLFTNNLYVVENSCKYFMLNNYYGIGYETTHRLLYIQSMKELSYNAGIISHKRFIKDICSDIYRQAAASIGRGPFFDLFLEQMFLCGVEGYMEFLNLKWLKFILKNQKLEGCFPLFEEIYMTNFTVINRCSEHATGLAAAFLSLQVHFHASSGFVNN